MITANCGKTVGQHGGKGLSGVMGMRDEDQWNGGKVKGVGIRVIGVVGETWGLRVRDGELG